jgi:serine/threonine-protein kinase
MGEVFEAEDLRLHRRVALKFLPDATTDENGRKRFLNEARLAAQLRHSNICPIFDVEESDGRIFLAMALIEGETLAARLRRGPVPLETALRWAREILSGLEAAHSAGIIHRDIKSSNLMVDPDGHITILDFGLAQRGGDERLTQVGYAIGTPAYMAPEQARGIAVDERADIWAFGMVLFETLTGRLPEASIDAASTYHPGLSPAIDRVVAKALASRPTDRWVSAREMRLALEGLSQASPPGEDSVTRTIQVALPPARVRIQRWWWLTGLGVIVAVLAGWGLYGRHAQPAPEVTRALNIAVRRVAILPLTADADTLRAVGDGLLELLSDAVGEAERSGQPIWAVPVAEVRSRKLASAEEARRVYGVDYAVRGKAEAAGSAIRLTLDLVETAGLKQIGHQTFLYHPAQPLPSRELALVQMRKLLSLDPVPARVREATLPSGDAYAAYLEGRGLMARYDRTGNLDLAIERFAQAVKADPAFAIAHACLAEAYWAKAKRLNADPELTGQALDHARRAVSLNPGVPLTHIKLGKILAETGQHDLAIAEFQSALKLAPGNAEASRELAEVMANQGKFAEAERLYLESIRDRPTDWFGHLQLAFFYEDRARFAESEQQLREAGQLAPENETVVRNLGRLYRMQGRYREAVNELLKAIRLQPSARSYNSLGVAYYLMHDYRKSVVALETAIELDGAAHQYWGNLGASSALSPDDRGKSVPSLRKAAELAESHLKVTPKQYFILADLAEYRARLGDAKASLAALARIPEASRGPFGGRIVVSYELMGRRAEALQALRTYFTNPLTLRELLDEPVLVGLRGDPAFAAAVEDVRAKAK